VSRASHRNRGSDGVLSQQSPHSVLLVQVSPVSFPAPPSEKHGTEPNHRSSSGCSTTNTGPKDHGRVPRSRHPLCRRSDYDPLEYAPRLNIVFARLEFVLVFSFPLTSQCARQLVHAIPHDATRWCVLGIVTDVMGLANGSFNILGRQLTWRNRFCNRQYVHCLLRDDTFYYVK